MASISKSKLLLGFTSEALKDVDANIRREAKIYLDYIYQTKDSEFYTTKKDK